MVKEHQIPSRIKNFKDSITKKLQNISPEMLELAFILAEKWLGDCCNCKDRHMCWSGFMATADIKMDNLMNAMGEQFTKCDKLYCWNIDLEGLI